MKNMKLYIFFLITLVLLVRCSSDVTKKERKETKTEKLEISIEKPVNELNLEVNGIACWINAMPGTDEPKFHVTGDFVIPSSDNYKLDEIKIKTVVISQDEKKIYYIRPTQDFDLQKAINKKRIRFSTIKGLRIESGLNKNKSANIEIIFTDNKNKFSYFLNNIKIEEAY